MKTDSELRMDVLAELELSRRNYRMFIEMNGSKL